MSETIVAVATAHGIGGISIVRLSGENALSLSDILVNKNRKKNKTQNSVSSSQNRIQNFKKINLKPRYATLCELYDNDGNFMDESIVIYYKSPNSFTGEDIVEFQIHGGFTLENLIMDELITNGARIAMPGEFSKRAFLNDKMDLSKAEAMQSIILSRSKSAAKILARNFHGELKNFVINLREEIVKTMAFVETCIDYADDDLPNDILDRIQNLLSENITKIDEITQISASRRGLIEGFKVAIIGKPNVGKSSILNSLLKFSRAIVSDEAGTTRDRIEENLQIGSHLIRIIDTAGIRKSENSVENIGISYSIKAANEADIILAVFDASREFDKEDEKIFEILQNQKDKKIIKILNKIDLALKFKAGNSDNFLKISAKNDTKIITKVLNDYLNSQNFDGIMLSSNRQIMAFSNAGKALKRAQNLLNENSLELFAFELNIAIKEIASIYKPFERDEILESMFSNFCLGK